MARQTLSAALIGCYILVITFPPALSAYQLPAVVATNPALNAGLQITITVPSISAFPVVANRQLSLPPFSLSMVHVQFAANSTVVPAPVYSILQLHSCLHPLSLSYTRDLLPGQHQNGTNLGLQLHRTGGTGNAGRSAAGPHTFYLHNYNYYTVVEAQVTLIAYDARSPQPGACSLESALPELPSLQVNPAAAAADTLINVDTPLAADSRGQCAGAGGHPPLTYQFYALWLPRSDFTCATYFEAIRAMQTPLAIRRNGWPSVAHPFKPQRRTYARFAGTAMVVATIVTGSDDDSAAGAAAYVPAYIAACSPQHWAGDCQPFAAPSARLGAAILLVVGAIRAVAQPLCVPAALAVDAFGVGLLGTLVSDGFWWRLWSGAGGGGVGVGDQPATAPDTASIAIAVIGGLLLATILVALIFRYPQSTLCVTAIVANMAGACLVAAFVLDTMHMADPKTSSVWWFELLLAALMVAGIVTTPCYLRRGRMLGNVCCATFAMVQAIGMLSDRGVHGVFVVLSAVRTFRVPEYGYANSSVPYERWDWLAVASWIALGTTAMWTQVRLERWAAQSRHRRQLAEASAALADERTPIVTRWTAGSDDVFESPETNYRFFSRLRRYEAV